MSNKLDKILSEEIKRFNKIMSYQDRLSEGHHYKFYEAEEDEIAPEEAPVDAGVDTTGGEEAAPVDAGVDTTGGEDMGADMTGTEEVPATDDAGVDTTGEVAPEAEGDVEVDVTELVNSTKEMAAKADDIVQKIANSSEKIEAIINKVNSVEQNLQKMDSLVQQMDALTKQVELMRPPTEEERRKVLAKGSYPFSVTQDEYMSGDSTKTQTDLEKRPDKMSMMDSLMNNYNEMDIKNSFYKSDNNDKPVSNY
jgi:hypothetical protein